MKLEEIQRVLQKVHYKDWFFFVKEDQDLPGVVEISIQAPVADIDTGQVTTLAGYLYVDEYCKTPAEFLCKLMKRIEEIEVHEARELFNYHMSRPFNPHKKFPRWWDKRGIYG